MGFKDIGKPHPTETPKQAAERAAAAEELKAKQDAKTAKAAADRAAEKAGAPKTEPKKP